MAFETVKAGIVARLNALGYTESSKLVDFKNASSNEYANRFILKCVSGQMGIETIIDRFDDLQEWQILIAFERSENSDIINHDEAHRAKDALLKDIDKPANWSGIAKILKYKSWEFEEGPNYYVLRVTLSILDTIVY